jgi:hypothetical protein
LFWQLANRSAPYMLNDLRQEMGDLMITQQTSQTVGA